MYSAVIIIILFLAIRAALMIWLNDSYPPYDQSSNPAKGEKNFLSLNWLPVSQHCWFSLVKALWLTYSFSWSMYTLCKIIKSCLFFQWNFNITYVRYETCYEYIWTWTCLWGGFKGCFSTLEKDLLLLLLHVTEKLSKFGRLNVNCGFWWYVWCFVFLEN